MTKKSKQDDYVPYGEEWEKEMMKLSKPYLIDIIRRIDRKSVV